MDEGKQEREQKWRLMLLNKGQGIPTGGGGKRRGGREERTRTAASQTT
jgi:hypothetical protein